MLLHGDGLFQKLVAPPSGGRMNYFCKETFFIASPGRILVNRFYRLYVQSGYVRTGGKWRWGSMAMGSSTYCVHPSNKIKNI